MRQYDRRPAALPVTVRATRNRVEGGIHLDSANLSEGGAFLHSDLLFEVGETLNLEIPLPSGAVVKAAARVVRVARDRDVTAVHGMGIEFTGISAQDRQLIQEGTPWQRPSRS
jgi:c-di-GMP-binding flagellar brake protein YcgR